jgi:hypothetical protein
LTNEQRRICGARTSKTEASVIDVEFAVKVVVTVVVVIAACVIVFRLTRRSYVLRVRGKSLEVGMRPTQATNALTRDRP